VLRCPCPCPSPSSPSSSSSPPGPALPLFLLVPLFPRRRRRRRHPAERSLRVAVIIVRVVVWRLLVRKKIVVRIGVHELRGGIVLGAVIQPARSILSIVPMRIVMVVMLVLLNVVLVCGVAVRSLVLALLLLLFASRGTGRRRWVCILR